MLKFKTPIIVALVALVLSFFIGLISGVNLSTIFLRSLILAIISGAFAYGATEVLKKIIPEMFDSNYTSEKEPEMGKNINISIDEPIDFEGFNNEDSDEINANFAEAKTSINETKILTQTDDPNNDDNFEEDASVMEKIDTVEDVNSPVDNNIKELEELPDMTEFVPAESVIEDSYQNDFTQDGTGKFSVSADLDDAEMDAGTMAKAIRTVLKKDS